MRAVYFKDGQIELREVPAPAGGGRRVRVRSTGICGSDLHMLAMKFPLNGIVGHEVAGLLDDGTPVAIEPSTPCGDCDYCRAGDYNLCPAAVGTTLGVGRDGGMADEISVPESSFVYLPSNVDVKDACLLEPLAVAVHGMRRGAVSTGERVGVIGGGAIGLCTVAAARGCGATAGLSARYDHQKEAGRRLGATEIEKQYDVVAECTGTAKGIEQAVKLCRPGGRVVLVGTHWEAISYRPMFASMKEVALVPSYMYSARGAVRDFDIAARLLSQDPGMAKVLITHRFPLDEVRKAFEVAANRSAGAIKVVLEP